ncbi:MAG: PH domain-containing protein [Stellaceae bacterium]
MGYTEKVLRPGETLRFSSRIHWIVYVPGIVLIVLGFIAAVLLQGIAPKSASGWSWPSLVALGIGVVFGLLALLSAWWRRVTVEVAVTGHRVIYKRGFVRRHTFEMNMSKVESVHVNQSVLGRVFDYGDIIVRGAGSSFEPLRLIAHPIQFRNNVIAE